MNRIVVRLLVVCVIFSISGCYIYGDIRSRCNLKMKVKKKEFNLRKVKETTENLLTNSDKLLYFYTNDHALADNLAYKHFWFGSKDMNNWIVLLSVNENGKLKKKERLDIGKNCELFDYIKINCIDTVISNPETYRTYSHPNLFTVEFYQTNDTIFKYHLFNYMYDKDRSCMNPFGIGDLENDSVYNIRMNHPKLQLGKKIIEQLNIIIH